MPTHERFTPIRLVCAVLAAACATLLIAAPTAKAAPEAVGIPTPCDIPGADLVCDAAGAVVDGAASATADFVMRGVTVWVTNAAVWIAGQVGTLIDATASPNVQAGWFQGQYAAMVAVAAALALPLLLLAVIQAVWRQDIWILLRAAFGYLPMAFILAAAAIVATQLLIEITDDLSAMIVSSLGSDSTNLLQSVGDAYKAALDNNADDAIPLFGIFLGAIILADRRVRLVARDDHPRRRRLHRPLLPPTHVRRDDLARHQPLGQEARRAARRGRVREVRCRRDHQPRERRDHEHHPRRPRQRRQPVRADDRRLRLARPRRLVTVRAAADAADDGTRRRDHHQRTEVRCRALPARPGSRAPPPTCAKRWTARAEPAPQQHRPRPTSRPAAERRSRAPAARPPATNDATGAGSVPAASRPPAPRPASRPASATTPTPPPPAAADEEGEVDV